MDMEKIERVISVDNTELVYRARLKAKERLLAKYGQNKKVLRAIKEVAGV